jgi:hypothetical protein
MHLSRWKPGLCLARPWGLQIAILSENQRRMLLLLAAQARVRSPAGLDVQYAQNAT